MTVFRRWGALLRVPGALPAVLAAMLGRLSFGMTGLAVLLLVEETTGSYAVAGTAAAVYGATLAVASPVRARSADLHGPTRVLRGTGLVHPAALAAFLALVHAGAPLPASFAALVVAGGSVPPLGSVMRSLWAELVPDDARRAQAYAMEAVLVETSFVVGPLLVALCTALGGPLLAVAASGLAAGAGALLLSVTRASLAWRPHGDPAPRHRAGPLVAPAVRTVMLAFALTGVGFGAVEVATTAFAEAAGQRSAAGVLLSVWAVGSVAGGLLYGGRSFTLAAGPLYVRLLALLAVGALLPSLAPGVVALGVLLGVYGLAIAPSGAVANLLLSRAAPAGTLTEAFAWTTTSIFLGAALGNAAAGLLVEHVAPRAGLLLAGLAGVAALLAGLAGRRALADAAAPSALVPDAA